MKPTMNLIQENNGQFDFLYDADRELFDRLTGDITITYTVAEPKQTPKEFCSDDRGGHYIGGDVELGTIYIDKVECNGIDVTKIYSKYMKENGYTSIEEILDYGMFNTDNYNNHVQFINKK